ncbi:MAG: response regulator [Lachnospiraceae bacterium]|nr:response regulator [Lachnospiraceae bacterium]MBR5994755.1 response regulator [Lachnospiraceae bacterium]
MGDTGNSMVFIAEKESFIVRVLVKKVQDAGVFCRFVPYSVNDINAAWGDASLITLYMDDDVRPKDEVLHYLTDSLEEKNSQVILLGAQPEIDFVSKHMSSDLVYKTFTRPIDNEQFAKTITEYYDKVDSGEFKKSILIVDDDPNYLNVVRQWLKNDYKVSMANSGLQAIKFLGKNKVDLILLDHEMPVTSGPQVLEMLRNDSETKNIPVMFLTGKSDKESVMAVVALKPEGYFLKNIQRGELLEKLQEFFILHK